MMCSFTQSLTGSTGHLAGPPTFQMDSQAMHSIPDGLHRPFSHIVAFSGKEGCFPLNP